MVLSINKFLKPWYWPNEKGRPYAKMRKDFNSLWPDEAIWQQRSRSTLAKIMVIAWQQQPITCWLLIYEFLWHSPGSNFTVSAKLLHVLPHWCWDKMAAIFQTFSNAFFFNEVSIYPGGPGTQVPSGHCIPGWVIWSTRVPNSISILRYTGGPTRTRVGPPEYRSRVCVRRDMFCNITFLSDAFKHFWASSTKLTGIAWRTP